MRTRKSGRFDIVQTESYVAVYYYGRVIYMSGQSEWVFDPSGLKGHKITTPTPENHE